VKLSPHDTEARSAMLAPASSAAKPSEYQGR
jgi:hypothetical protein